MCVSMKRPALGGRRTLAVLGGLVVAVVGSAGLVVAGVHSDRAVAEDSNSRSVAQAQLQDEILHCINVETESLVSTATPVVVGPSLAQLGIFLEASGTWLDLVSPQRARATLTLAHREGKDSCHGTVVEMRQRLRGGATVLRLGHGASVPGRGPIPAQRQ